MNIETNDTSLYLRIAQFCRANLSQRANTPLFVSFVLSLGLNIWLVSSAKTIKVKCAVAIVALTSDLACFVCAYGDSKQSLSAMAMFAVVSFVALNGTSSRVSNAEEQKV
jgi:hypothetical protein